MVQKQKTAALFDAFYILSKDFEKKSNGCYNSNMISKEHTKNSKTKRHHKGAWLRCLESKFAHLAKKSLSSKGPTRGSSSTNEGYCLGDLVIQNVSKVSNKPGSGLFSLYPRTNAFLIASPTTAKRSMSPCCQTDSDCESVPAKSSSGLVAERPLLWGLTASTCDTSGWHRFLSGSLPVNRSLQTPAVPTSYLGALLSRAHVEDDVVAVLRCQHISLREYDAEVSKVVV